MNTQEIQERLDAAMDQGRFYDQKSDESYAEGDAQLGRYWGNIAIKHYTKAEIYSRMLIGD